MSAPLPQGMLGSQSKGEFPSRLSSQNIVRCTVNFAHVRPSHPVSSCSKPRMAATIVSVTTWYLDRK
ncbi:hypothetical protein BC938DRAFT_475911 [Jimgerdemannia flammicorona]|uniref:Uncharacterized protein n=1 Tax=Jimgerdemannia flammicorona TaxID=994334 RepID=A0A433QR53_9FUNG|nr:hypothetical protein BC938DRAFT_475911 [Jimgerdemannia flammicorona]